MMRSRNEQQEPLESQGYKELQVIMKVEAYPDITQRILSQRAGIALGLTNSLLRNLIKKGYLRAQQASWKRWVYGLTPQGFSYKIRLTVSYIHRFLDHYQAVRQTLNEQLQPLALHKESRVAIFGVGEFAELVYLGLKELRIEEIEVFSTSPHPDHSFLGMPVKDVTSINQEIYDHILIAQLNNQSDQALTELIEAGIDKAKLVTFFQDVPIGEKR